MNRDYIGSTDAAVILGISPFKSPLALYLELRGEIESEDISGSDEVRFGTTFEDAVIDEFLRNTGREGTLISRQTHHRHPDAKFIGDTPDAEMWVQKELIEAKTATIYHADEWSEGVPDYYAVQCHHHMMVTGFERVFVPVYFDSRKFEIFEVERNENICKELFDMEVAFWQQVQDGDAPLVTSRDTSTLARWFPHAEVESADLEGKYRTILERIRTLGDIIKTYEDEKEYLTNSVKRELGVAEIGLIDGEKLCSWKEQGREGIDAKAIKEELPEVYDKYKTESRFRVFRLHGGKK